MEGFCYVITDKNHSIYYASSQLTQLINSKTSQVSYFSLIEEPKPSLFKQLVEQDIKDEGYFNGYMRLTNLPNYWFCDYGKRYDNNGQHIGYEALIHPVSEGLAEYMTHFYQGLTQKSEAIPDMSLLDAYIDEKKLLCEITDSTFPEFMLALQDQYE